MSNTLVVMEHPALGSDRQQTVSKKQFEQTWVHSGWVIVEEIDINDFSQPSDKKVDITDLSTVKEDSQDVENLVYADAPELSEEVED